MQTSLVSKQMVISINGSTPYLYNKRLSDGRLQFEHEVSGEYVNFQREDFAQRCQEGSILVQKAAARPRSAAGDKIEIPLGTVDFGSQSEPKQKRARRRLTYAKALFAAGYFEMPRKQLPKSARKKDRDAPEGAEIAGAFPVIKPRLGGSAKSIKEVIEQTAKRIGDKKPPSVNAVRGWVKKILSLGATPEALIDHPEERRKPWLGPELEPIVEEVIEKEYLTDRKLTVAATYRILLDRIETANKTRAAAQRLVPPSKRTLERRIATIPEFIRVHRREGAVEARRRFRGATQSKEYTTRILEVVEIDHTRVNLQVYDDEMDYLLGRPWITCARDRHSGMILGFYLSFSSPGLEAALACIQELIMYKGYIQERYPQVKTLNPCFGIPELILADNAFEFHSPKLRAALEQLGVDLAFHATKRPWLKGGIERVMHALNSELIEFLPGTTFANPAARKDYKSAKHACVRFSALVAALHKWVCDVHAHGSSDLFGKPRIEVWKESARENEPFLPYSMDDLHRILSEREQRTLRHDGIRIFGLPYASPEVHEIRKLHGESVVVDVLVDRRDLGSIHVQIPGTPRVIRVPCLYPSYANGLSLLTHRMVMRRARKKYRTKEREIAISVAFAEILTGLRAELKTTRLQLRRQLAQMAGANSQATNAGEPKTYQQFLDKAPAAVPALEDRSVASEPLIVEEV
jgi:putative transposase